MWDLFVTSYVIAKILMKEVSWKGSWNLPRRTGWKRKKKERRNSKEKDVVLFWRTYTRWIFTSSSLFSSLSSRPTLPSSSVSAQCSPCCLLACLHWLSPCLSPLCFSPTSLARKLIGPTGILTIHSKQRNSFMLLFNMILHKGQETLIWHFIKGNLGIFEIFPTNFLATFLKH